MMIFLSHIAGWAPDRHVNETKWGSPFSTDAITTLHADLPIDTSAQRNGDHPFSANDDIFEPYCRLGTLFQRNEDHLFLINNDIFKSYYRLDSRSTRQRIEKNKAVGVK
jgi:hypothetical protein